MLSGRNSKMSAAQSQTTLESLECHFTWGLILRTTVLLHLKDKMEDKSAVEGKKWLGHTYNLWGYIQHKLGMNDEAKRLFQKAAEAFKELRGEDEGTWLVVNYGNLAWLHHLLGEQEESQGYLSRLEALMERHPPPPQGELHAEVCAEKAWTLMYSKADRKIVSDYYKKAAMMKPEMVEWNSSYVIELAFTQNNREPDPELLEKMSRAKERDPENLFLATFYLKQLAMTGTNIEDEVRELARNNLKALGCGFSGARELLMLYMKHLSTDEAIELAERALEEHPSVRYLKSIAANCYRERIIFSRNSPPEQKMINRAISLHEELLSLYPSQILIRKIDLAKICAKSHNESFKAKAEQMFQELLQTDMDPADKQQLLNDYAKYLYYDREDTERSVYYHMKVAKIPVKSSFSRNSIKVLEKTKNKGIMVEEIEEFLRSLQEPSDTEAN